MEATQEKTALDSVREFAQTVDIDGVMEVAEVVSNLFPPPVSTICFVIIKVLRLAKNFVVAPDSQAISSANSLALASGSDSLSTSNEAEIKIIKFIDIAMEDGVITPEEESFILSKAESLGLDVDMVKLRIISQKK